MTHAALRTRLPAIAPDLAALQTRLLGALDRGRAGDLGLRARAGESASAVIRCETTHGVVELAPLLANGQIPMLVADDGRPDAVHALDALGSIEPLVAAIEVALGVALRPVAVAAPSATLRIVVEAVDAAGIVVHAVLLGVDADAGFAPRPRAFAADLRIQAWRLAWRFVADGPVLSSRRIAALAPGDLVLVGGAVLPGKVVAGGRHHVARLDPAATIVTLSDAQGVPAVTGSETLDPDLRLALTLTIDGGAASLGDLARLAPGSVLPLGIPGTTLAVTLDAGGAPVAAGELVAVGDAYGVLITRRLG